jgi:hypothetical protein
MRRSTPQTRHAGSALAWLLPLLLATGPALAAPQADAKRAAAAEDDEEDDDILAPVRGDGEKPASAVPEKAKALKVGFLPIVPIGDASKVLGDQLTTEVMKAFNESATVEVVALSINSGGAATVDTAGAEAAKKEGDELLGKAQSLLAKLNFGKAKKGYELAIAAYEKAAPVLESPQPLMDAWLGLAEVAARQAQDDETRRCLSIVAAFNPEYELDKKKFPGLFLTAHRKSRDALIVGKKASIFVDETATGAAVVVDGRVITEGKNTTAPARFGGLFPGHHLVRVLREGQPAWGTVVVVAAEAEGTVSPGFLAKDKRGAREDLAQNKLSPEAAGVVAEAARGQNLKGAIVGVASKDGGKVPTAFVYVDAASGNVALLPPTEFQAALLDVGIEALKARARLEELASAEKPELAAADGDEALIEGAKAGAAVEVSAVTVKYDVKVSKEQSAREVRGADDGVDADDDEGGERTVKEAKSGTRKTIEEDKDPYVKSTEVDPDAPFTEQPWFMPTVIGASVVGAVVLLAGTGVGLVAAGVIPDPRPASGAQVDVSFPAAAP